MSKIICDVCGTSYPETATQCPICGCVRSGDKQPLILDAEVENETYGGVKGGRFSKNNVRKRTKSSGSEPTKSNGDNRGLVITAIILLLAIIAVAIYIAVQLVLPANQNNGGDPTDPVVQTVPCESITLNMESITLDQKDAVQQILVTANPSNTTDEVIFTSSNEAVATVTKDGVVKAVGAGQVVITVKCGDVTKECAVACVFDFRLIRTELKLTFKGQYELLYAGELDLKQITWTSDDETVATITDGTVTAVANGTTTVHGEYMGLKVSCIVTCAFTGEGGTGGNVEEDKEKPNGEYRIDNMVSSYDTDCILELNNYFHLQIVDSNEKQVSGVNWSVSDDTICSIEVIGNECRVTALAGGYVTVTAEYEGNTYTCIVRVSVPVVPDAPDATDTPDVPAE